MKRWSGFMVIMMGLLVVLGGFAGKGEAASATPAATVTTTNDLQNVPGVGYTLSFTPITPVNSNNRIVLGAPFSTPITMDPNAVTISDGTTTIHPLSINVDGSYYYIEVGSPLNGTLTITFPPSFGITNPAAGNYTISLTTANDGQAQAATANLVIGTTSTLLQSLSIDGATLTQTSPTTYTTVVSSVYLPVSLHVVPVDPSANVSVFSVPSASDTVTDVTYATYDNHTYYVDIHNNPSINVAITTADKRTSVYTIGIISQTNLLYLNFQNSGFSDSTIAGTLRWGVIGFDIPAGATYQVALMNDDQNVVTSLADPIPFNSDSSTWNYTFSVPTTSLTSATTRIGVVLKDTNGTILATKSVPIWKSTDILFPIWFSDTNPHGGSISAELNWLRGMDDSKVSQYRIYYVTQSDTEKHLLDTVTKNTYGTYKYTITPKAAPGASKFLIGIVNNNGEEAPQYPTVYVYDDRTMDALPSVSTNASLVAPTQFNVFSSPYSIKAVSTSISIIFRAPTNADGSVDSTIKAFNLYFTDRNGVKISPIATIPNNGSIPSMSFFNPVSLTIPTGAVHFAIYTVGQDGAESTSSASGPIGLMDLNGNEAADLSDVVIGLKASYNLNPGNVHSLLYRLIAPHPATTS